MTAEPVIVFDTNCLRQIGWNAPAFRQLVELSSQGDVKVYVPEIVYHERRTQWREEFSKGTAEAKKALERFAGDPVLSPEEQRVYAELLKALPQPDAEERSLVSFERLFREARFGVVAISQNHAAEAFRRYFAGATPFKGIKARPDIPDGFVFAAMAEVAEREGHAYCLSADKELIAALKTLSGITVLSGVEEVMQEPDLIALRDQLDTNKAWLAVQDVFPWGRARDELTAWLVQRAPEFLEGALVWSERIPSRKNEGIISSQARPSDVGMSDFVDWGSGDLSTSMSFTSNVEIEFLVDRSDANAVPDWVVIKEDDSEPSYDFRATGVVRVQVKINVTFRAIVTSDYDEIAEVISQISLDHEPRISFLTAL